MRKLSLLLDIYLAAKQVNTGIFRTEQVLQDHVIVVEVCRHHALRRAQRSGTHII